MITIQTTDLETIKRVFANKQLFDISLPDNERLLRDAGLWEPDPNGVWEFVEVCRGDEVIGIMRYQPLSIVAIDVHIHILPDYWGGKVSAEVIAAFEEYIRKTTKYHKIQLQSPKCCLHTIRCAARNGYEVEGILMGASFWDGKVEDLVLLGKFIRRI